MKIQHFYDPDTFTLTYVVFDEKTKDGVLIDPVLDFDPASGKITTENVQKVSTYIQQEKINLHYILETHAHADHLTGSQLLKEKFPLAKIAIGSKIVDVQTVFKSVFNLGDEFNPNGEHFDELFEDYQKVQAGTLLIEVIPTPGHTPACVSFHIGDAVFTGDALFMPDYGTGRCDFPKGSAKDLYHSVHDRLYKLDDKTRVFVGHDYQPNGRVMLFETTIGESKKKNIQLKEKTSEIEFVEFRQARDLTLKAPRLLLPSLQVNIKAGELPIAENNGKSYLKIPITEIAKG
jgi:glyoxylase-like metal-dependent hydrolase (beta-lactamase superfamily II)